MGLFDLFKGGGGKKSRSSDGDKSPNVAAAAAAKWAERAADKRAQNYDRQEAIAALAEMGTAEAAAALLKRFTFHIDPSITDQEEKDAAYQGVVAAGQAAVPAIRSFAAKAESLAWPIKILKELLAEDELVSELLVWLSRWDTEYAKFSDPKLQLLAALEELKSPKILESVLPFLEDVSGDARYFAVGAVLAQGDEAAIGPLLTALEQEESLRVKNRILDGFVARAWAVPEERRAATRKALPPDCSIDASGNVVKR